MHRNRTLQTSQTELRTQRNRILPIIGGDGSAFGFDFTATNEFLLGQQFTFSRTGNATFINSQGLLKYAKANLIAISESLVDSTAWTGSATAAASDVPDPTGGTGGSKITNTGPSSSRGCAPAVTAGIPHVCRFWIRAGTSTKATFGYYRTAFQTGTVSIVGGDTTPTVSGTGLFQVTGLTNNWTQIEYKLTAPINSGSWYFYPDTHTGTVGLYNYVWGVQMNIGTVSDSYVKTTGTAYQAPRFEYSEAGQPLGLLLEGPGKNSILWSEDQSNGAWVEYTNPPDPRSSTKSGKSTTIAPDGSTNGNKLIITGTGDNGIYQTLPTALKVVDKRLTLSVWVWTESGTGTVRLNYFNGASSSFGSNETITTKPRRITRTITISGNVASPQNVTISNSGGAVTLVWWGYQMEEAWQPSSYIQTTSAEASRNTDVLTMSGTNFTNWFKQNEGTALMSFDYKNQGDPAAGIYPRVIAFAPSANSFSNPQTTAGYSVAGAKFFVNAMQASAQITDAYTLKSYAQGTNVALGFSYSNLSGKTVLCVNGDAPTTATNSNTYGTAGIGQLSFTRDISSGVMHLKFFKFWRDAKPAAELQQVVNNANYGYTPAIGTVYVTGDMGSLLNYNSILEGATYASRKGGSIPDDWATADKVTVTQDFNFGIRAILTSGDPALLADNFGYNADDTYLETSIGMQSAFVGSEITLGMYSALPPGLAGRIEMYKWEDKRTIVSAEFKT